MWLCRVIADKLSFLLDYSLLISKFNFDLMLSPKIMTLDQLFAYMWVILKSLQVTVMSVMSQKYYYLCLL